MLTNNIVFQVKKKPDSRLECKTGVRESHFLQDKQNLHSNSHLVEMCLY